MKKILLSISLLSACFAQAQFTEANHAPTAGDVFSTYQCDSTGVGAGTSGAGSTWDYSTLVIHTSLLNNYTSAASTNTANMGFLNVSSSLGNSSYYSSTPTSLSYFGGNITAGAVSASLNYTTAAVVAVYPMNFNTTTSNTTGGSGSISGFGNITFTGSCNVIADGTGTLTLAGRSFTNAVRVKTTQALAINGGVANVTLVNYDYYSITASERPIVTISTSTLSSFAGTSTQTIVTQQKDHTILSVNESELNNVSVSVFPNPASSIVNFNTSSKEASKIIGYDVTGKVIATQIIENGKAQLNINSLSAGIYVYSVIGNDNQVLARGKFNVSH